MSSSEVKSSLICQVIDKFQADINSLSPELLDEQDKFSYLEAIKYSISNIPEQTPQNIVNNSLKAIEELADKWLGDSNNSLNKAITSLKEVIGLNNHAEKSTWVKTNYQTQSNSLRQQFNQSNPKDQSNQNAFIDWIYDNHVHPSSKQVYKQQVEHALSKFTAEVNSQLPSFILLLSAPRIKVLETELENLKILKERSEQSLQYIDNKVQESKKLVAYMTESAIYGHYTKEAKKEETSANLWRIASILSMFAAILWLFIVIHSDIYLGNYLTIDKYRFFLYFLPRGSLTLCILGLSSYFGIQASLHRKNADYLRKRAFALQAVSPYLDNINNADLLVTSKQKVVESLLKDFDK